MLTQCQILFVSAEHQTDFSQGMILRNLNNRYLRTNIPNMPSGIDLENCFISNGTASYYFSLVTKEYIRPPKIFLKMKE